MLTTRAGQYDKANDICKWLLLQQDLGQYHQAGAHFLLAHSPDCYVEHAREALRIYEKIKTHCDGDTKWAEERVAAAETLLREADEDKKKYSEPMTDEEYDQAMIEASHAKYQADQAWPHLVSDDEDHSRVWSRGLSDHEGIPVDRYHPTRHSSQ